MEAVWFIEVGRGSDGGVDSVAGLVIDAIEPFFGGGCGTGGVLLALWSAGGAGGGGVVEAPAGVVGVVEVDLETSAMAGFIESCSVTG
jgi:hypothetical protein